jgi:uncharacterized protein with ParB-like and HNH nuclease domain
MAVLIEEKNENMVRELFENEIILRIPLFQRSYGWEKKYIAQLIADVNQAREEGDTHFLGPVIVVQRQEGSFGKTQFEVIDGQQRITTIFLIILNTCRILAEAEEFERAKQFASNYLIKKKSTEIKSNLILHPSISDRSSFNEIVSQVFKSPKKQFKKAFDDLDFELLPPTGESSTISNRNKYIYSELKKIAEDDVNNLYNFLETLFNKFTTLTLRLNNPLTAYKIFARLNGYRLPVDVGDLVRNDVFSKTNDDEDIEDTHKKFWEPFYKDFDEKTNEFVNYFFPFTLIEAPKTQKPDTFNILSKRWENFNAQEIISDLSIYKQYYLSFLRTNINFDCKKELKDPLDSFFKCNLPSSILPFLLPLIHNTILEKIDVGITVKVISLLESFFVRRFLCKHEPTGLHAVFKGMWNELNLSTNEKNVRDSINKHGTVKWPNDNEFTDAIKNNDIYTKPIFARFLLRELDKNSCRHSSHSDFEIEHILPQEYRGSDSSWRKNFSSDEHAKYKNIWANLIPIKSSLNKEVSVKSFKSKSESYKASSEFFTARKLAETYTEWTPDTLEQRSEDLVSFALKRWFHNS